MTLIRIYEEVRSLGYDGSYDTVRRYAKAWAKSRGAVTTEAYVPLYYAPGEAYQFDLSYEIILINGVTTTVKVAHVRLCHYREQRIVLNTLRFLSNRLQISLVCFGVNDAREAIGGDVQLARRFDQFTLSRWAANEQFEMLVALILRNTPLQHPSVLTAKSLRRILQVTEDITANIFHIINSLAIEAIQSGRERITDEAIEKWEPEFDADAAFA